jgi:thiamine biosynthesis protein ThiS
VTVRLNGGVATLPDGATVVALLESSRLQSARVAVELNGRVLPRTDYDRVVLAEGDVVEVVQFVGGG